MKRTRVDVSEKAPEPNVMKIICPLTRELTGGGVNYDIQWMGTTKFEDDDGNTVAIGAWRSAPKSRSHGPMFFEELKRRQDAGEIYVEKDGDDPRQGYYFTDEEGQAARREYVRDVLAGKTKAHKRSWGPDPRDPRGDGKGCDKSRFFLLVENEEDFALEHGLGTRDNEFEDRTAAGLHDHLYDEDPLLPGPKDRLIVTFSELKAKYPDLYATTSTPKEKEEKQEEVHEVAKTELELDGEVEPTEKDMHEAEEFFDQTVHAATLTEEAKTADPEDDEDDDDDWDHHDVVVLRLTNYDTPPEVPDDSMMHEGNRYFRVEIPEWDCPAFVQATDYKVAERTYRFVLDEE